MPSQSFFKIKKISLQQILIYHVNLLALGKKKPQNTRTARAYSSPGSNFFLALSFWQGFSLRTISCHRAEKDFVAATGAWRR